MIQEQEELGESPHEKQGQILGSPHEKMPVERHEDQRSNPHRTP
jgi:hypothetical protein